jgi:probable biosynthetic protein (TIGR04098 family)
MLSAAKRKAYDFSTAALRWHYRRNWGMTIGEGVRISRKARLDGTNPKGVKIGDYTAIGPGAVVFTHDFTNGKHHDTEIGQNCFIGGNAMILAGVTVGDNCIVAAGAVVFTHDFTNGKHHDTEIGQNCFIGGNAMILAGVTVGDNCIVAAGAVVFTHVPSNSKVAGNPARVVESNIVTGRWGIQAPAFLAQEGVQASPKARKRNGRATPTGPVDLLASYLPDIADASFPFEDLDIDSFALITLRAEIEETEASVISDEDWTEIECPADLLQFMTKPKAHREGEVVGATAARSYEIGMPQMALGGLSESWLFKEVGDVHWSLLTNALGVRSRDIADQHGDRLYATFTRLRYRSTGPLADVLENDALDVAAAMTRFGAGMFFSSQQWKTSRASLEFEVMSSFSKFGSAGDATSLTKGQPAIPEGFTVPSLAEPPCFSGGYRDLRAKDPGPALFETEYEILPQHDINGVRLLYFAAYPTIADICLMRHLGPGAAMEWSPVERDVCYFANAGSSDTLIYRLHQEVNAPEGRRFTGSLTRASDGKRMARIEVVLQRR